MIHVSLIFDQTFWAINIHRLNHWFYQKDHRRIAYTIYLAARWITNIDIYPSAVLGKDIKMPHGFGIVIGDMVEIGDRVVILQQVTIGALKIKNSYIREDFPTIQNDVVLGAGSKILGGIVIYEGATVGANSVVLESIPPGSVAVGVPAKLVNKNESSGNHSADIH
jgi:serine O-acetyltransferase